MAYYDLVETPLGPMFVGGSGDGVHRIDFITDRRDEAHYVERLERDSREPVERDPEAARVAVEAVRAYFAGDESAWDGLPPLAARGTEFQAAVWHELMAIPRGATVSYGEIAMAIGRPSAARAVGRAVGTNPLAVVVPCHRVVGSNGAITGYASGLDRKRWLLAHEHVELALN